MKSFKEMLNLPQWSYSGNHGQYGLALSSIVSVVDYAIVAFAKFFTSVFLARYALPAEFGAFALAFGLLTFYNCLQIGLVGEPLTVLGASAKREHLARYIGIAVLLVSGGAVFLGILTIGILSFTTLGDDDYISQALLALSWTVAPVQLQDLFRRALFAKRHSGHILGNDLLFAGLQLIGLFWIRRFGYLTASNAFFVIGVSASIATVVGGLQIYSLLKPISIFSLHLGTSRDTLRSLWKYGRWSLGSQIAFNISTQGYLYMSGVMLGSVAAGVLKACQNLVAPIQIFLSGMENLLMAVGSQQYTEGGISMLERLLRLVGLVMLSLTLPYIGMVILNANKMLEWLYKGQYDGYSTVVVLYALYYLAFAASRPLALGLRSIRRPSWIFRGYLISAMLTVLAFFPLIHTYGVEGAAIGSVMTSVVFLVVVFVAFAIISRNLHIRERQS